MKLKWRRRAAILAAAPLLLVILGLAAFLVLDAAFPFPRQALEPPVSVRVVDADGRLLRCFLAPGDSWSFPVALDELPAELTRTVIASEDGRFASHHGVDPLAVLRAARDNAVAGRVVSGASTITMQLARLAEPKPRTLAAKLVEAFRSLQLERFLTKDKILAAYLNLAPYGRNIVGVAAAGRLYFGKEPAALSLGEAALLAILPRSPANYDPVRHPEAARAARDRLLDRLAADRLFSTREIARAKAEPLPSQLAKLPFIAPHFAEMAKPLADERGLAATTLDAQAQQAVSQALTARVADLRRQGLENAAAVVLERESGQIKCLVGSAAYLDRGHHGFINAALIPRSPGSTLKPFLYAMAFDSGRYAPESLLLDLPTDYAGYVAENYDGIYNGRVTIATALSKSLNAPAVRLLADTGLDNFYSLLKRGGISGLTRPASTYGLPLVLGACEVRLLELTALYRALATGGTYAPPRLLASEPAPSPRSLFSPGASELVGEILTRVKRPDMAKNWELSRDAPSLAWKTGTSYGHRDAWAVGFSADHVIGVWVGNLDGTPVKGISGATHAGPLLFDLFRTVERTPSPLPAFNDPDLTEVEVCAVSRLLPGRYCPHTIKARFLAGREPLCRCDQHKRIFVDADSGYRLEGPCLAKARAKPVTVTINPPELDAWLISQGLTPPAMPAPSPLCAQAMASEGRLAIVSPSPATPYRVRRDAPLGFQKIALSARVPSDVKKLWWYQDGRLVASAAPNERAFIIPEPGSHRLVVADDQGRIDAVTYKVEGQANPNETIAALEQGPGQ